MEELTSPNEAVSAFNEIDGIDANEPVSGNRFLVKVNDEEAIGHFFRICRENDLTRTRTTRDDLDYTVLDSWVSL